MSSRVLFVGVVALLLNSAYLAGPADPSLFYVMNVLLHPVVGLILFALLGRRLLLWSRAPRPPLGVAGLLTVAIGALLGVAVLVVGGTRPYRLLVHAHVALSVAGSTLLAIQAWRTASRQPRRAAAWSIRLALCGVLLAAAAAVAARIERGVERREALRIQNPTIVPASMDAEGGGPKSPFFPSSADTNVRGLISGDFFLTSDTCGQCHRDIYEQWNSSMHHFSSFNNQWYRKSIEYMQDVVGVRPSKWCAGCHDHAMFFQGSFERPVKDQIDTPEAQAGLGCTSCHAITRVKSTMGQADFEIGYPALHRLAASRNGMIRALHDKVVDLAPRTHRDTFLKPFHREQTPEFCSTCHKVHLDVPVNAYRWFRGFNDYDSWQASGVSGEGARSFYYPAKPQKCADCHMPLVDSTDPAAKQGKVRSHRFAAANTAVPFVNGDHAQLKAVEDFLKDGQVTIDVFGIARVDPPVRIRAAGRVDAEPQLASTFAIGEESAAFGSQQAFISSPPEVLGPFGATAIAVHRGESVRLEVVVRTRKVGHFFPGGTVDAFDVWVELEAVDDRGRTIYQSGALQGGSGPVDPGSHFYRSLLLDEHGNRINKRNAWAARSVAYVRLVPPGAADTVHYRLDIPPDCGDQIFLTAKLKYRKFSWWNTQWAFAGVRDPTQPSFALAPGHDDGRWVFTGDTSRVSGSLKRIPKLPVIEMAANRATLTVLPSDTKPSAANAILEPSTRERWNDYGIGLLLQGDIKGAEAAFLNVTTIDPAYADGWVNVGRARIQEGNMSGAEQVLRKALEIDPELAKTHFFLASALKALGRYDEAIAHLQQAAASYPRDRVVLNQLGRVLFLKRQFAAAIVELQKVLTIDPEDLQAHYNLMLCYQGLGDSSNAAKARVLFDRFKADESSQAITGDFRRLNPDDNNERQSIHEHRSQEPAIVP